MFFWLLEDIKKTLESRESFLYNDYYASVAPVDVLSVSVAGVVSVVGSGAFCFMIVNALVWRTSHSLPKYTTLYTFSPSFRFPNSALA